MHSFTVRGKTQLPYPILFNMQVDTMTIGVFNDHESGLFAGIDLFYPEDGIPPIRAIFLAMSEKGQVPEVFIYPDEGSLTILVRFCLIGASDELVGQLSLNENFRENLRCAGHSVPPNQFKVTSYAEAGGFTRESLNPFRSYFKEAGKFRVNLAQRLPDKIVTLMGVGLDKIDYGRPSFSS